MELPLMFAFYFYKQTAPYGATLLFSFISPGYFQKTKLLLFSVSQRLVLIFINNYYNGS